MSAAPGAPLPLPLPGGTFDAVSGLEAMERLADRLRSSGFERVGSVPWRERFDLVRPVKPAGGDDRGRRPGPPSAVRRA